MQPRPRTDQTSKLRHAALLFVLPMLQACVATAAQPVSAAQPARVVEQPTLTGFQRTTLEIRSRGGRHWLKIWLAQSNEQQMQGLMFVRELPADEGMLFPLETPRLMTMWMKNTLIPLDMLFIDARGRVACVQARAVPQSLDLISCDQPVKAVLEIGGGQAAARGIAVGDSVVHPSIGH